MIDEKTFYRAVDISGNSLVYRINNGFIDYDSWVEETMLYKPYHFQYILKCIQNLESLEVKNHLKYIIREKNIIEILQNNHKIAFANKSEKLYNDIKNRITNLV